MIPCPACKSDKDQHEAENSYGWDWDAKPVQPVRRSAFVKRACRVCQGTGLIPSYDLKTDRDI